MRFNLEQQISFHCIQGGSLTFSTKIGANNSLFFKIFFQCKQTPYWFNKMFHFNTENGEEESKLDQGALGMLDPCGPLQLVLKPNSVSSINCLLSNYYFFELIDQLSPFKSVVGLGGPRGS